MKMSVEQLEAWLWNIDETIVRVKQQVDPDAMILARLELQRAEIRKKLEALKKPRE